MKILVPLDGSTFSEAVLPYASLLARSGGYSVTLLSVWDESEVASWRSARPEEARRIEEQNIRYFETYLRSIVERLKAEAQVEADYLLRAGRPAAEIASTAKELGVSLIAMSTHGRSGITRWARGSVADEVIRTTSVPTLLVGPETDARLATLPSIQRILVPLDGSPLSEAALNPAIDLARTLDAMIVLLRVAPWATPVVTVDLSMVDIAGLDAEIERGAADYLLATRAKLPQDLRIETVVLRGTPANAIIDYEREGNIGLVVMSSRGRSGLSRLVLGSVADRVIHGPVPVLLIYPEEEKPE